MARMLQKEAHLHAYGLLFIFIANNDLLVIIHVCSKISYQMVFCIWGPFTYYVLTQGEGYAKWFCLRILEDYAILITWGRRLKSGQKLINMWAVPLCILNACTYVFYLYLKCVGFFQVIDQRYHAKQRSRISYSDGKMRSRLQRIYAGRRCKGKQRSRISCSVARVMNVYRNVLNN